MPLLQADDRRQRPCRVLTLAYSRAANPYLDLFAAALAGHGIEVGYELQVRDSWLRANRHGFEALHIHWPEALWHLPGAGGARRLRNVAGLWRFLRLGGRQGLMRIWTVHNLQHHEGSDWVDELGYRVLARHADLLICHSRGTAAAVVERHRPRGRVVVMPIGSYTGLYPEPRPRAEVLARLGLRDDLPVVCSIGQLRPYKGLEVACAAARLLAGKVQLVIAGNPHVHFDVGALRASLDGVEGARVLPQYVSDQEFADLVAASEAMVLPYRKITGSSAVPAACSLGRGVVASDLPFFRETLEPQPDAGVLFEPENAEDLARAVLEYLGKPAETRRAAAHRLAQYYSWERCIVPVVEGIRGWLEARLPNSYGSAHVTLPWLHT
jgi:glycosyltransferase involved in cell wall biosynthesis